MENHIAGGKEFLCRKVIKAITFLTKGVTKKHTSTGSCIKLVFREKIGGVAQTTKYSQDRLIESFVV